MSHLRVQHTVFHSGRMILSHYRLLHALSSVLPVCVNSLNLEAYHSNTLQHATFSFRRRFSFTIAAMTSFTDGSLSVSSPLFTLYSLSQIECSKDISVSLDRQSFRTSSHCEIVMTEHSPLFPCSSLPLLAFHTDTIPFTFPSIPLLPSHFQISAFILKSFFLLHQLDPSLSVLSYVQLLSHAFTMA